MAALDSGTGFVFSAADEQDGVIVCRPGSAVCGDEKGFGGVVFEREGMV